MKVFDCTVTVPARKKDNIIYLDDWHPRRAKAPVSSRPRRPRRADLSTLLELAATLAAIGVPAALILRLLLF